MWYYNPDHPLRRLFAALTEQTFCHTLGVADPPLVDYLALLLSRFVHMGAFYRLDSRQLLRLGELVRVTTGAFEDMIGRLVELRDQDRIVVLLELLGRAVRAQLRAEVVEPA